MNLAIMNGSFIFFFLGKALHLQKEIIVSVHSRLFQWLVEK